MASVTCPRCDHGVALHEGRPHVSAHGVELWHRSCWDARDIPALPVAIHVAPKQISRKLVRTVVGAVIGSALIGMVMSNYTWLDVEPPPAAAMVALAYDGAPEPVAMPAHVAASEVAPGRIAHVESAIEARWPVPEVGGTPLDELYPTLRAWTHPVVASAELMPEQVSRHFGTPRLGVDVPRPECGEGHCGVDLDGPRGRALVAVADGVVVRVERHEMGLDGKSGRYVRIAHEDGTLTAYMHMDEVDEDLQVGDHVVAGQFLGTLGSSATYSAPPHCHFSLEIPNHAATLTDTTDTHYVDPAPFLVRSDIVQAPIRRHAVKPSF